MSDLLNYKSTYGLLDKLSEKFKVSLFKAVTKNSSELFLRGRDSISIYPQVISLHEPELTKFIKFCNKNGASDFFLDIGANIGLITCQVGSSFKEVYCFEPNPLCQHILKVNTEVSLGSENVNVNICEYGLGENNETLKLWVPRKNWGGAFVRCDGNKYNEDILSKKDGFKSIDNSNYYIKNVEIRSGREALKKIFSNLAEKNFKNGFIKIDVEGMELTVLKEIALALPDDVNISVIFENFDKDFDFNLLDLSFKNRSVKKYKLDCVCPYTPGWPSILKGIAMLFKPCKTGLKDLSLCADKTGEIVMVIE